ncbi:MAG: hemolysin III family protein, partial [Deinococcus sp.]|nr:hemolysin III family protein [Deinococcus sp.]
RHHAGEKASYIVHPNIEYGYKVIREPFNTYSHLAGVLFALAGTLALVLVSGGDIPKLVGALVFGLTMLLMYTSSSLYHALKVPEKVLLALRKLDHAAIFLFIAGSYTPLLITALDAKLRPWALGVVWGLAVLGVALKVITLNAPRWLYTLSYLGLGWLAVFLVPKFDLPASSLVLIAVGGLAYSVGAVVYAIKKPNPLPGIMGFHGLWHLFVLVGSVSIYAAVLVLYVLR